MDLGGVGSRIVQQLPLGYRPEMYARMMDWIDVDSCVALVRIPRAVPLHAYPTGGRSVGSAGDQD